MPQTNTLDELLSRPRRRVRVLDGPLMGATYEVWSGIRMGRRATCDILMLLPEISRDHAQLVEDAHGDHWLVDLESSNGTWIGAQRIGRQLLLPGTVFRLGEARLIYEDEPVVPRADAKREVRAVSYHHASGRRSTRELCWDGERVPPTGPGASEGEPGGSRMQAVEAVGDDGHRYEGCLVDDLVEYRNLRLRMMRYGLGTTGLLDRLERLEGRLWGRCGEMPWQSPRRRPLGFACRLPAGLRFVGGASVGTTVTWLGVGGAEVVAPRFPAGMGEVVWLAFELVTDGRPRTVVSTCRVSWIERDRARLSFVGLSDEMSAMVETQEPTIGSPRPRHVPTKDLARASGTHG